MSVSVPGVDSIPEMPGGGPYLSAVTEGYFQAMGTTLLQGRGFTSAEVAGGEPVIVVGASMARSLWPDDGALGKCVRVGGESRPCSSVVGVAEDVHRVGYREPASYQYYVPLSPGDNGFGGMALVLRRRSGAAVSLGEIRARLSRIDPRIGFVDAMRLEDALAPEIRPWRLGSWTLGVAGMVALLVSVVGVYGVLAYLVEQRRREIGVRMALGASRAGVSGRVVRAGVLSAGAGVALGVGLAVAARPWVAPFLFETSVLDPVVVTGVTLVLLVSAAVACLVPAMRAARIDPAVCLKEE
jgi:hypothetical protein